MEVRVFKRKLANVLAGIEIIAGIFIASVFGYLLVVSENTVSDIIYELFFAGFGLISIVLGIMEIYTRKHLFLSFDDKGIKGRFDFFRKMDVNYEDVDFVCLYVPNRALRFYLKDGREFASCPLENPMQAYKFVRPFISDSETKDYSLDVNTYFEDYEKLKTVRSWVMGALIVVFGATYYVVFRANFKTVVDYVAVSGLAAGMFFISFLMKKYRKQFTANSLLRYKIQRSIVKNSHYLSGNEVVGKYTNDCYAFRVVVYHSLLSNKYFSTYETFDNTFTLVQKGKSEECDSIEQLAQTFENLISYN